MSDAAGTQIAAIVTTITNEAIEAGWAATPEEIAIVGKMALASIADSDPELWASYSEEVFQKIAA